MASSKEYLNYILEQLSELEDITYKSMMGEYMIYYRGRIACYICDDRRIEFTPSKEYYLLKKYQWHILKINDEEINAQPRKYNNKLRRT